MRHVYNEVGFHNELCSPAFSDTDERKMNAEGWTSDRWLQRENEQTAMNT